MDSFCLGQTYTRITKQFIRDNADLLFVFKQDDFSLRHNYFHYVTPDVSFKFFQNICATA